MKKIKYSHLFKKQLKKIKGKELQNILKKRDEILNSNDLNHYKKLSQNLKKYKRVHVNNSYVILFFGDDGTVYFVDYAHHDIIYNHSKKEIKKYDDLKF
ncbi:addiction module toxin RelE [archaeon]|nr:addiction module toxin RelE [archaeon]